MVNFLLSSHKKAVELRQNYIIYVVPMLNPDGVIQGNHRTCLAGFDMNRRWANPSPFIHPVIFAVKNLATLIKEERLIDVYCDIHGHFQAHGGFMYCCSMTEKVSDPFSLNKVVLEKDAMLRVVPDLLSNKNEYFTIKHSSFNME